MRKEIRERISEYAETEYRDFSAALIPGAKQLLGVRLPKLREIAKEIAKGDWRSEVKSADGEYADVYFEETMLRGMIIGYGTAKKDVTQSEGIQYLEQFIPMIDDWSVCDSFCNSFSFANKHRDAVWEVLQKFLYSDKEFEVRVALILLLSQYLKYDSDNKKLPRNRSVSMAALEKNPENMERSAETKRCFPYTDKILSTLNRPFSQGYYAQMAAAWILAEAFVCFPYEVNEMLVNDCHTDRWTYNKAIQKIRESLNPDAAVKEYMKSLKKS